MNNEQDILRRAQQGDSEAFRLLVEAGPQGRMAGDLADALSVPAATLSFHLKDLVAAGLIEGETQGRYICYRARFDAMNGLIEFLTRNCCGGQSLAVCKPTAGKRVRKAAGKAAT